MRRWLLSLFAVAVLWLLWPERELTRAPGVLAPHPPLQRPLEGAPSRLVRAGYQIEPLARFELEARVLGVQRYRFDRGADLAPVDLALGWGRMSDSAVIARVAVAQANRFYYWRVREFPIPRREIETSSANLHIVPADGAVGRRLKEVRRGSIVRLAGYLIEARAADGWRWRSSLTREDTGQGSCELVWVERLELR